MAKYTTSFAKVSLLLLIVIGYYAIWGIGFKNGFLSALRNAAISQILPDSLSTPLKSSYTGIPAFDKRLKVLVAFFWFAINGEHPDVILRGLRFGGSLCVVWLVLMLESNRSGNKGKLISYFAIVGIIFQNLSFGANIPLYLAIYMFTSPLAKPSPKAQDINVSISHLRVIPVSIFLGYIVPSVMMCIKAPTYITIEQQQSLIAFWQLFPIWVAIIHFFLERVYSILIPHAGGSTSRAEAHRTIYIIGFAIAVATQSIALGISFSTYLFPDVFTESYRLAMAPSRVWTPTQSLFSDHKISSIGEGVLCFLQWDEVCGSIAFLIWAVALHHNAQREKVTFRYWLALTAKIVLSNLIGGPCNPALVLMWERDDIILKSEGQQPRAKVA
ncbi:MAG: hypothetical protein M1834_006103 [Cirrosporium novae-zelandiae]|nr:MAG: hypothetical protein M1834_006103 [Cirrosporium novae-zelandiae]